MSQRNWEPKNIEEAFFKVERKPIFMESYQPEGYKKLDRHFAIVDVEKDIAFAVVTDDYELVTNKEAYINAKEVIQKVFLVTQWSDMECLNIIMPKTRSFCHIDLIHKDSNFKAWEEDEWVAFLRITNSYNRTRLLRYELGFCRWICLNGMIFGEKSIEFSFAHTRRGKDRIKNFTNHIGDIRKIEMQLIEKFNKLKRFYVPENYMLPIVCRVFDIKATGTEKPKQI